MNKKGQMEVLWLGLTVLIIFSLMGLMLWFTMYPQTLSYENREQFCLDNNMGLSNDNDYCFDGFEKMYWIEPVGYGTWFTMKYEKDFKLVKEVVTLK